MHFTSYCKHETLTKIAKHHVCDLYTLEYISGTTTITFFETPSFESMKDFIDDIADNNPYEKSYGIFLTYTTTVQYTSYKNYQNRQSWNLYEPITADYHE